MTSLGTQAFERTFEELSRGGRLRSTSWFLITSGAYVKRSSTRPTRTKAWDRDRASGPDVGESGVEDEFDAVVA